MLHTLNDFLAGESVWLVIIVQAASLLLFLGYTMSAAAIEQRVRESPLFRGDSLMLPAFRDPSLGRPGAAGRPLRNRRDARSLVRRRLTRDPRRVRQGASSRSFGSTCLPISSIAAIGSADITWMETMSAPTSVTSGR